MKSKSSKERIEELENRLAEAEQLIEAIKAGEVDAFTFHKDNKPEVFTLQSGDYAYRVLVENFREGALNLSEDGIIVYTNSYFHNLIGLNYEQVIGHNILEFIDSSSKEVFQDLLRIDQGGESRGEINLVAGSRLLPAYISLTSLYPNLQAIGMIVSDLTEKKQQESLLWKKNQELEEKNAELAYQKEFSETIVNTSPDLIGVYDKEMRILAFNRSCEKLFGMKEEDVIGKCYLDLFPGARNSKGYDDLSKALNGETIHNLDFQSPVTGRHYENFLAPLRDADGNVYAAVVMGHDITEQVETNSKVRQSEEKFNKLFHLSPIGVTLAEFPSGKITDLNYNFEETTGYSLENLIGRTLTDPDLMVLEYGERVQEILERKGSLKNVEVWIRHKTGKQIPVVLSADIVEIGNEQYLLSAMLDITQRKKSEEKVTAMNEELAEKNTELARSNAELASFSYVASHDLQEPLRKIQTFSGRILEREEMLLSDNGKMMFSRMRDAAERMQQLIEDLLTYSRTNTAERVFERVSLKRIVEDVKRDLREELKEKNAVIRTNDLTEATILPFQFRQLLQNLISNSLKFTNGSPPEITIQSHIASGAELGNQKLNPNKKYCYISVSDTGIGFQPEYNEKIFELFKRLHGRSEYRGTGIGLSIVKRIVENHGGVIQAEGIPDKGATFRIYIPD